MSASATTGTFDNDDAIDWMQKIQAQTRRCDEENAIRRNLYKSCKSSGHNIEAIKQAIKNSRKDHETVVMQYRDEIRYSALRHIPLSPETLFDGMDFAVTEKTQNGQDLWDAEEGGYKAGRHGMKIDECPYPAGSELNVRWQAWWHKGQAAIAAEMGPDAKVASASRARPRRRQEKLPEMPTTPRVPRRSARRAARAGRSPGPTTAPEDGAAVY